MNLTVTQDNLYLFLPSKVANLAGRLARDRQISVAEAVREVYASDLYRKLEDERTKMWHLGPVDLYEEMMGAEREPYVPFV